MAKTKYIKKDFESTGARSDIYASIYSSMIDSPAWNDLTKNQQLLYVYCKLQYYGEKKKPNNNERCFTMNQFKWSDKYGLYAKGSATTFYKDIEQLILHGFIKCVEPGATSRTKNIYQYWDMWQKYETDDFRVTPDCMTVGMRIKANKNRQKKSSP